MRIGRIHVAGIVSCLLLVGSFNAAAAETVLEPRTETLYISAGCPPSTPAGGTCTSTRWLGKAKGDSTSNFLTATTPADEATYRLQGTINWRDYASDDSLRVGGYPLRADQPLVQVVTITANGIAANATVRGRIEGITTTGETVTFGPLAQTITLTPTGRQAVTFNHDIADTLEGVALESLTAYVAVHGINAQGGYIDQQGGSTVAVPYWHEVL